ncbi:MAG: hypothetical protein KatS3mg105_3797 [Gemmatales bacterium]|nr:MAG: hypothetical protein KatS3mg105_3797 [Gemmatales bacterium]
MFPRFKLASLAMAALVWPLAAADPKPTHDITVEDYFSQATIMQNAISPDGKYVAYTLGRWRQSSDDRKADLWLVETASRQVRQLTADRASDRNPQWSPNSDWIYFAGNRRRQEGSLPFDGSAQVWRVAPGGGKVEAVTRVEGGINDFKLSPDGLALYYTTSYRFVDSDWKALQTRFAHIEYGHGIYDFSRLWRLDLKSGKTERVAELKRVIKEFAVSPDGRRIAMVTAPDDSVLSFEGRSRVDVLELETKKLMTLPDRLYRADAPSPYGWIESLAWSSDGKQLAFCIIFDAYPSEIIVAEWQGKKVSLRRVQRPKTVSLHGYGSALAWRSGSELCFLGDEKARVRLYGVSGIKDGKQGEVQPLTPGDVVVYGFSFSADGKKVVVDMNDPHSLPDLYLFEGKKRERLTETNPQARTWKLPKLSIVQWKGADGVPVEGILELPFDYEEGERLPMVVVIHGGPTTANSFAIRFWIYGRTLLPATGYAVLTPNYRGSTGYGDKFLTDLVGRENDLDVRDILAGVDAMIERGIADPDRLGIMGWSNGGYLTNCILTKTTRFKAASSGASIVDTVMEFGTNDEPAYAISFKTGFPWNRPDIYHRTSPTYQLDKIRTPTLIHVGSRDERCPPGHSRMLYRALKEYNRVPTQLLVYPGEPHGLTKYKNREAKMRWDLAWFERYLKKSNDR